jgi:hypothetical protein
MSSRSCVRPMATRCSWATSSSTQPSGLCSVGIEYTAQLGEGGQSLLRTITHYSCEVVCGDGKQVATVTSVVTTLRGDRSLDR